MESHKHIETSLQTLCYHDSICEDTGIDTTLQHQLKTDNLV